MQYVENVNRFVGENEGCFFKFTRDMAPAGNLEHILNSFIIFFRSQHITHIK